MKTKAVTILSFTLLISLVTNAQITVDSLLSELKNAKEDTSKVILYRMLAGTVANSDPPAAVVFGKNGVQLGKKIGFEKGVAGCYLNVSAAFNNNGQLDSAMVYIDSAIISSRKVGDPNRLALVYLNRGDYNMQLRNFRQSLADCDTAWRYAESAGNNDRRARILQTMGVVYYYQKKYPDCKEYYERAGRLYKEAGNKKMYALILNNLAGLHSDLGEHEAAIDKFNEAIALANESGDRVNLPMYYGNMGEIFMRQNQLEKAEEHVRLAMRFAVEQNNVKQIAIANSIFGKIYLKQKKYHGAIEAGLKAFDLLQKHEWLEEQVNVAGMLAEAYSLNGNHAQANHYLLKKNDLGDSLARQKYDEDIAAMQTSFKVNEKNNEIALLNKDKELQKQRLSRQRIMLLGSLLLVALAAVGVLLLINRNRLRQRMKEMELRQTIAADLHDEVGSSISSIHMLTEIAAGWESISTPQKEMLHKVAGYSRETVDRMSDIVWMIKPGGQDGAQLQEKIESYLYELCGSKGVQAHFEVSEINGLRLSMLQKKTLYLVFKEAMNNALKYGSPSQIRVSLARKHNMVELKIADDGKGFNTAIIKKGNGLDNMHNRARELGGEAEIISASGAGTAVLCKIPVG